MNPKAKIAGVSAKNTKREIFEAYQELKGQLAEKKKTTIKTSAAPSEALENEIKQLISLQKQITQSFSQIFEALIVKTKQVVELIEASQEEEEKRQRKRRHEEEEYQFELSLKRKKEEAEFQEKWTEKEKELEEREMALDERKTELKQLQAQAAGFPRQLEQAIKETTQEVTAELKKEKEAEIKFLTQKFSSELSLAQFKIKSLEDVRVKQDKEINQLKDQLARATREVKEIAVAVIESRAKAEKAKPEENESEQ